MSQWINTERQMPPPNTRVDWIAPDGTEVHGGTFIGGAIWMLPGNEMYVYYRPAFWRLAEVKK